VAAFVGTGHGDAEKSISARFAGVQTTGLNATELHDAPQEEVERRMKEATKRLLRQGDVGAICLGCAGMSGMGEWVREACIEELGDKDGGRVRVIDGVQAGVAWLEGTLRAGF
jgi:Asp/Glu/hydantoin racemase